MMPSDHDVQPSYFGFVETRDDAWMLIQACLRGQLHFVQRRPTSSARPLILRSGHVFICDGRASGIQRWTDGWHWSPSRVLGDFLIYGERSPSSSRSHARATNNQPRLEDDGPAKQHHWLFGALARSFNIQPHNLVKKTISIKDLDGSGATWHLISYLRPVDVLEGRLQAPSMSPGSGLLRGYLPRYSVHDDNASEDQQVGEYSAFAMMPLQDNSQSAEHHERLIWPTLEDPEYDQANADQDLLWSLGDSGGALTWPPRVQLAQRCGPQQRHP
jgi:hypothetical protein